MARIGQARRQMGVMVLHGHVLALLGGAKT
jgi:hypothetical protein